MHRTLLSRRSGGAFAQRSRRGSPNTFFATIVLALIWLRVHPASTSPVLSVYAADAALVVVLLGALLTNLESALQYRISTWKVCLIASLLVYATTVVVVTGGEHERIVALIKVIYLALTTMAIVIMVEISPSFRRMMDWRVQRVFVGLVFIVVAAQLFLTGGFQSFVHAAWGTEKLRGLAFSAPRVYGTFYNANWFGITMALVLTHVVWRGIQNGWHSPDLLMAGLTTGALIATGSRSSALAAGVGVITVVYALLERSRGRVILRSIVSAAIVGGTTYALFDLTDVFSRSGRFADFAKMLNTGQIQAVNSAQVRIDIWQMYLEGISASPFLGRGQIGYEVTAHNSYLFAASLFGIIGGACVIAVLIFVATASARSAYTVERMRCASYIFVFVVGGMTAEYWFTTQVYLSLVAIMLSTAVEVEAKKGELRQLSGNF